MSVKEAIAFVTINRPERANSCTLEEHRELSEILRDLARDDEVNAAVVTGAGNAFCAGGQLDMMRSVADEPEKLGGPLMRDARELVLAHVDLDKPIVAAINGVAMGSGAAFALFCDFIVMERQAMLADGHIRAAIAAGDGGAALWPLTVGLTKAKQYLLTGDAIAAEDAERLGLVTEVVEEGESLARATAIAKRLVAGPQTAIRYSKRALNQWLRLGVTTAFDYSLALESLTFATQDAKDALDELKRTRRGSMPPDVERAS